MRWLLLLALGCSYELPPRPVPGVTPAEPARTDGSTGEPTAEVAPEPSVEPPRDGGADIVAAESKPESPATDASTEAVSGDAGPCVPRTSAGCPDSERCTYNVGAIGCPPTCTPAGDGGQWDVCSGPLGPECSRGYQCAVAKAAYRCQKYCSNDLDCGVGSGFTCVLTTCGALSWRLCWKAT